MDTASVFFDDIHSVIKQELDTAESSLRIAVAWFTDHTLFHCLLEKLALGVAVVVIVRNDIINLGDGMLDWQRFIEAGGTFYVAGERYPLHHKFCIVDKQKIVSGSYNWTYAARRNTENVTVLLGAELAETFAEEFSRLLQEAREVVEVTKTLLDAPPAATAVLEAEVQAELVAKVEEMQTDASAEQAEQLFRAAYAAYLTKEYEQAKRCIASILQTHPDIAEVYKLLGEVLWRNEEFEQALTAAKRADELGLHEPDVWNLMGLALQGLKKYQEAITCFDRSIQVAPKVGTWYCNKCSVLDEKGLTSKGDQVAMLARPVLSDEIRRLKNGPNSVRLVQAYLERARLSSNVANRRQDARAAQQAYNGLASDEQDLHDLDDIRRYLL